MRHVAFVGPVIKRAVSVERPVLLWETYQTLRKLITRHSPPPYFQYRRVWIEGFSVISDLGHHEGPAVVGVASHGISL